ncbi:unnamed protein product [Blepharisma stoltei]|uniref:DOMON domain-containing protein n=1 Tax=Blepharisma stoltei TaxID=1481888 RepID=A0AAU9IB72_9CILI|nr:unnamed protein product [Blepharisma stoltei]
MLFLVYLALQSFIPLGLSAIIQSLSIGTQLAWYFPDNSTITFYYLLPTEYVGTSNWEWIGIGFLPSSSSYAMTGADIITIETSSGQTDDRFASDNGYPSLDTSNGGKNSLQETQQLIMDTYTVYSWTRQLNTEDNDDLSLQINGQYLTISAKGNIAGGDIAQHSSSGTSSDSIVLAYDASPLTQATVSQNTNGESQSTNTNNDTTTENSSSSIYISVAFSLGFIF